MITKILLAVCILITATAIMSMFLAGCTSDTDKEYEDLENNVQRVVEWLEMWKKEHAE